MATHSSILENPMDGGAWWVHGVSSRGPNSWTRLSNLSHSFSSINLFVFVYFRLHWVFVAACELSPVAASRSYSLSVVLRFLIVVVSRVAEHRL